MELKIAGRFGTFVVALGLIACPPPANNPDDQDGDGFTAAEGDCADFDETRFPGATEVCNELDDNCNSVIDENFDLDLDGFSSCTNPVDCDEFDNTAFPGNTESDDGVDNNCDGIIDNLLPTTDDDGDGVTEVEGDCDDADPLRSPSIPEIEGDTVDNDCNQQVDEPPTPCDQGANDKNNFDHLARAIGLCNGEVISAEFVGPSDPLARALISSFGNAQTSSFEGTRMLHLSSGIADTNAHSQGTNLSEGDAVENQFTYPDRQLTPPANGCGDIDPLVANDYTELAFTIQAPTGAESASFRFQFFSAEYPRFRCSAFDDTFKAILESDAFTGNISFDANGNVVSLNSGFFEICEDDTANQPPNICPVPANPTLNNTGYDPSVGANPDGGATRPLTTTFPITPGETFTLRFIIYDEGENAQNSPNFGHILDSSVLIDQFVWHADPVDDPSTIP